MRKIAVSRRGFVSGMGVAAAGLGLAACSGQSQEATTTEATGDEAQVEETGEAAATGAVVETAYGPVQGITEDGVNIYYGVPYGAEPTGELRWQAPVAPEAWTDTRDCTTAAEAALQLGDEGVFGTEDCLYLDVYAPEGAENLPVLVFLHGGNNQTGNTAEILGNELVKKDECVFVTLSYRLGLLGFNCLPAVIGEDKNATGNFAMLDVAFALDWVRENIAAFGGDPNNVTISGFSAGGRDVMAMLISPTFAGKFEKAIAFSGGMTTADTELSSNKIAAALAPLVVEDGKADDDQAAYDWLLAGGDEVKEYLFALESDRLAPLMGNASIRMSVFPHLYADDVVIPADGFATTTYNSVPLLMLTGATEFSFFCLFDGWFSSDAVADFSEDEINKAKAFANTYGSDMYRIFNAQMSAEQMFDAYGSDIYIAQVDYGSANSAMASDLAPFGAFHGIFVPMLATKNNYAGMIEGAFDKAGYVAMAEKFNAYLKAFLATGDPNGEGEKWDPWTPDTKVSMVFDGDENDAIIELKDVTTTYDDIIAAMEADDSIPDDLKTGVINNVTNGRWFSDAQDEHFGTVDLWLTGFEK